MIARLAAFAGLLALFTAPPVLGYLAGGGHWLGVAIGCALSWVLIFWIASEVAP